MGLERADNSRGELFTPTEDDRVGRLFGLTGVGTETKSWSAAHKPPTAAVQTNTAGVSGGCRMRKAFITTPTPTKVPGFWSITCYNIGGLVYSLDDIEHGVLRANKGHPAAKRAQFSNDDPRSNVALTTLDPRIHFALNCGAKSCPPIRIYKEDRLNSQLDTASKSFLQQEVKVTQGQTDACVETSRLLLWYGADFGRDDRSVIQWLAAILKDDDIGAEIEEALAKEDVTLVFKDYDWGANAGVGPL